MNAEKRSICPKVYAALFAKKIYDLQWAKLFAAGTLAERLTLYAIENVFAVCCHVSNQSCVLIHDMLF